ncbi:MAG: OmpA family protein [Methylococcales bacterium]|nr:OmpA family protein [Methylococcales bacterium]
MKKSLLLAASVATAILSGCATTQPANFQSFQAKDLSALTKSKDFKQKTNNFFVISDSSGSMTETYINGGLASDPAAIKLEVEKELLSRMNKTIPSMTLNSGLRSFGFGKCVGVATKLNQASESYSKSAFNAAIDTLACGSGGSPMDKSLDAAQEDLAGNSGKTALIIFSDGFELDRSPIPSAHALKSRYGDDLCIYTVWTGNPKDAEGRTTLLNLSNIGACGFSTATADISSPDGMAKFVEGVFFKKVFPVMEGDADLDGVFDSKDQCPKTPLGATVNIQGCWIIKGINFDTAKHAIKSRYYHLLDDAAFVLKRNPGLAIEVQGHTDNVGSDKYNLGLSDRRAKSVKGYLNNKAKGKASLTSRGYGEAKPVASNDTTVGRAQNRRVQLKVIRK